MKSWLKIEQLKELAKLKSQKDNDAFVILSAQGNIDHGRDPDEPICEGRVVAVATSAMASRACQEFIAANYLGSGEWAGGQIYKDGQQIAEVAYNGRVLDGQCNDVEIEAEESGPSPR